MPEVVHECAPAKLNLALSVGPPTAAGMHPIASWMATVDLLDELELRPLPAGSLSRYAVYWHDDAQRRTNIDWPIRTDLTVRAHLALQKHVGRELPVQLKIAKRIPVGGGLGGGSSNAAAMLRGVNQLYELGLCNDTLVRIGATIGSDVPFFVAGGSASVSGIGDIVERHDVHPQVDAVIVMPEQSCETTAVYRQFDSQSTEAALRPESIAACRSAATVQERAETLFNDLTEPAVAIVPQLKGHLRQLADLAERPAHMTGSGSSLFIICDDALHAEALAGAVQQRLELPAVAVNLYEPVHEPTAHC